MVDENLVIISSKLGHFAGWIDVIYIINLISFWFICKDVSFFTSSLVYLTSFSYSS